MQIVAPTTRAWPRSQSRHRRFLSSRQMEGRSVGGRPSSPFVASSLWELGGVDDVGTRPSRWPGWLTPYCAQLCCRLSLPLRRWAAYVLAPTAVPLSLRACVCVLLLLLLLLCACPVSDSRLPSLCLSSRGSLAPSSGGCAGRLRRLVCHTTLLPQQTTTTGSSFSSQPRDGCNFYTSSNSRVRPSHSVLRYALQS